MVLAAELHMGSLRIEMQLFRLQHFSSGRHPKKVLGASPALRLGYT